MFDKTKRETRIGTRMEQGFDEPYNVIILKECAGGELVLSKVDGEDSIYLYPDQVEALKNFLSDNKVGAPGVWQAKEDRVTIHFFVCSNCGQQSERPEAYCPGCHAKMS